MNKILVFIFIIFPVFSNSQNSLNLVPNWSFEFGQVINNIEMTPKGEYHGLSDITPTINDHIKNWEIAYHKDCKGKINTPDWLEFNYNKEINPYTGNLNPYLFTVPESCCPFYIQNDIQVALGSRFMFLDSYFHYANPSQSSIVSLCKKRNKAYEAIRVGLNEKLEINATYILKIKYKAMQKKFMCDDDVVYTGINTLRIHFSKWGQHWYSTNSNNQLWKNAAVIWKNANYPQDVDCNWHQVIFEITVPSNMPDLGEMIIYCEEGAFFIDDVELYKKCPEIILVQNQEINIFNQSGAYSASDKIIAGNSVDPAYQSGDVIVSSSGSVEFVAGNEVRLKPGFKTSGGYFHAYNDVCGNNKVNINKYKERNNKTENVKKNNKESLTIYPNPNNGVFAINVDEFFLEECLLIIKNQLG